MTEGGDFAAPGAARWAALRAATPARVALGRAGFALPTRALLDFQLAHARAADAVHAELDVERLQADLGGNVKVLGTAAEDRAAYLQNPGLGRRLGPGFRIEASGVCDVALILADGLSAGAVMRHGPRVAAALRAALSDLVVAPPVIVRQGRVAVGDPVGAALGARISVVLIGERPGLSATDSLGAYLTYGPRPGRSDSERNCVSNIRAPGGLAPAHAADKIAWLVREMLRLGFSGVELKDRAPPAPDALPPAAFPPNLPVPTETP